MNTALEDPAIGGKLSPQGTVPRLMTAAEYKSSFVVSETEKFGKIVAQANIKL